MTAGAGMAATPPRKASLVSSWREKWLVWRGRLIADAGFQRWAADNPLTRFIARRNMRALFDLCAGFVYSQVLLACVRLDVFEALRDGPEDLAVLAEKCGLDAERARRLLLAAASLRLLRALPHDRFALGDLGAALLGDPSIGAFVEHHRLLYDDLRDPVALLRGGMTTRLSQFWPYAAQSDLEPGEEDFAAYSTLMARSQELIARDVLDAYPLPRHRCLLDVGGGEGVFVAAAAERAPHIALKLFDLPAVAARAQTRLRSLGSRVEAIGGNFLCDDLPRGADVISLVRVLHDHEDAAVAKLLRAAHDALPPGGTVIVAEPFAGTSGAEPVGDAYFGMYLLAMGRGRARSATDLAALLRAAGFEDISSVPTRRPLLLGCLIGQRL
jgi:demethylspheroidene O-methyltransferase